MPFIYDYKIVFSWIEKFFLVIILCQVSFLKFPWQKLDGFILKSEVFFWQLKMFQKDYKTLDLKGMLEFGTTL